MESKVIGSQSQYKDAMFIISYIKMKVCMCVCVCPAACRRTYTTDHPKIWRGLLISAGLGTEPGGNPKCWPQMLTPGGTPFSDPVWKTLKGKELGGGQQTKVAPWVGFAMSNFICGGSPKPGARRVHPTKWGCMLWELGGGQQTKVAPGWVCKQKFYLWVAHPNPKPAGSLDQSAWDFFCNEIVK